MKQIGLKLVLIGVSCQSQGPHWYGRVKSSISSKCISFAFTFSIALASGNLIVGNIEIKEKEKTNSLSEGLYCR